MYAPRRKWCFVLECKSTSVRNTSKVFINVPRKDEVKRKWFKAARRDIPKSKSTCYCCEDHFNLEEDIENYLRFKMMGGNILLKEGVIPHIFDCQKDRKRASNSALERTLPKKRQRKMLIEEAMSAYVESTSQDKPSTSNPSAQSFTFGESEFSEPPPVEQNMSTIDPTTSETVKSVAVQVRPSFRNKAVMCHIENPRVHAASSPFKIAVPKDASTSPLIKSTHLSVKKLFQRTTSSSSLEDDQTSDAPSTSDTDFEISHDTKDEQTEALNVTLLLIMKRPKHYLGIPDSWFPDIINLLSLKTNHRKENIMLTLMKIKLNDPFFRLADMFGMSISNASKIFKKTVVDIEKHLKTLIYWPPADRIKYLLPIPFRAHYSNVQSIIDCLEIQVEKPSDPVKQALTWSEYKKCNTLKYLISATPDGLINFISKGYGGRISDTLLVQKSGYLKVVPKKCSVMADRDFKDIGKLLHEGQCELIRHVSSAVKPSRAEVLETKRIASLRIHIEHIIRRLREFEYLKPHAVIDHSLIMHTDRVIQIACALINLQPQIIRQT